MGAQDQYTAVNTLLEEGKTDQAAALARVRKSKEIKGAEFHLRWADLLEELGLFDDVVIELNLAIRDDPKTA